MSFTKFLVKKLMNVNLQNLMKTPDEGKFTLPLKYWGQLDSLFEIFSLMKVFFISEKISRS